uniref:NEDD4 binding protein 2 n=1 Tax=Neolamprologus brichardi TaxID=32507 RepID=A0A3Q4HEI5_NEOBR
MRNRMLGNNPIIIDNTNMQGWEMKPYVALKHDYKVLFKEPDTWWKHKPKELVRRTTHNVHVDTVRRMLEGYERFVTVQSIMGSQMPERKRQVLLQNRISHWRSWRERRERKSRGERKHEVDITWIFRAWS